MKRIENKIDIFPEKKIQLFEYLKKIKAKMIFEKRNINSIYFENSSNQIYQDSIEGISPRKKIRLRCYGKNDYNNFNNSLLETKLTGPDGREKFIKNIVSIKKILNNGIFDNMYGVCNPRSIVSYTRSYYTAKNFRITFDENIKFYKFDKFLFKKNEFNFQEIIAELKSNDVTKLDELNANFPFQLTRFSKYTESIECLDLDN